MSVAHRYRWVSVARLHPRRQRLDSESTGQVDDVSADPVNLRSADALDDVTPAALHGSFVETYA